MTEIIMFAQTISPLGVIALLVLVIWQMVKNSGWVKGNTSKNIADFDYLKNQLDLLGNNHLSGLPELIKTSERLELKTDKMIDLLTQINTKIK